MKRELLRAATLLMLACGLVPGLGGVDGPFALASPQQTRDTVVPAATGTGVVAGAVVTDDADRKPVRRATVTLGGAEIVNGRGGQSPRQTMTDDQGRFLFASL